MAGIRHVLAYRLGQRYGSRDMRLREAAGITFALSIVVLAGCALYALALAVA